MDFPVQVVFMGLVAFAPYNQSGPPYMALLPQSSGQHASDGCLLPTHYPRLIIKAKSCMEPDGMGGMQSCKTMDKIHPGAMIPQEGKKYFTVDLSDLDLRLNLAAQNPQAHQRTGHGSVPENPDDAADLYWVPSISKKSKVNGDCLDWLGGGGTCPAAARVRIENAYLATCNLVEASAPTGVDPVLCSYRFWSYKSIWPLGGEGTQAIADGTSLQYVAKTDPLVLDLGSKYTHTPHSVTLVPDNYNDGLILWITNLPVGDDYPIDKHCATSEARARDYEIYYNLLDQRNGPLPISERPSPTEVAYCRNDAGHRRQPQYQCPSLPAPYMKPLYPNDQTACGHMMLSN